MPKSSAKNRKIAEAATDLQLQEWARQQEERNTSREHRCGQCFGPLGKSAIRCKNEPITPEELRARADALRAKAADGYV